MLYPLTFAPLFKERVWGGRRLETLYRKQLPSMLPVGESWEVCDRPSDVNVVINGPLAGRDLHSLLEEFGADLIGRSATVNGRFPLLVKILDAKERLSLQVHPPAQRAKEQGGDPKTEMWYVASAEPGAVLYAGLRQGVTKQEFARKLSEGMVEECFHRVPVRAGDAMFLPSGRVHAIGEGLVIFEIQQNSDSTYRVFDWNRPGLDGKPRTLHVKESLKSIDFNDFEPSLVQGASFAVDSTCVCKLVEDALFAVDALQLISGSDLELARGSAQIFGVLSGKVNVRSRVHSVSLDPGQFCLVPAVCDVVLSSDILSTLLRAQPGAA
jgi:mannose-6-phosphate isomerase